MWFTVSLLLPACVCAHLGCLAFHWAEAWCNKAQNRFILIRDGWLGNEWWKKKGPSKWSLNRGVNQKQRADNIAVMGFWGFCLYMFPQIQSPVKIQALKQAHKMCCFCVSRSYREQSEAQISWVISSCSIICPRHPAEWMRVWGDINFWSPKISTLMHQYVEWSSVFCVLVSLRFGLGTVTMRTAWMVTSLQQCDITARWWLMLMLCVSIREKWKRENAEMYEDAVRRKHQNKKSLSTSTCFILCNKNNDIVFVLGV